MIESLSYVRLVLPCSGLTNYPFGPMLEFVHTLEFLFATFGCRRSVFRYSLKLVGVVTHVRVRRVCNEDTLRFHEGCLFNKTSDSKHRCNRAVAARIAMAQISNVCRCICGDHPQDSCLQKPAVILLSAFCAAHVMQETHHRCLASSRAG